MDAVLDPAPLARLREMQRPGRPDIVGRILHLFSEDVPRRLEEMAEGLEDPTPERLHRAAHTMKSSAANVGAIELAKRAEAIERAAKEDDREGARALLSDIEPIITRALNALRDGATTDEP